MRVLRTKKRTHRPAKHRRKNKRERSLFKRGPFYSFSAAQDIDTLIGRYSLQKDPSPASKKQIKRYPQEISELSADNHRLDLSKEYTITIDGDTAKDFDDAISLEKKDGVYHLGVHIADVSYFVPKDSAIDKEARQRGCSFYLLDRVIPMLPFRLSNDLCSLVEGKKRATFSCLMRYNSLGERIDYRFVKSIIKSTKRCTYDEVENILYNNKPLEHSLVRLLNQCESLKSLLYKRRIASGSIDIETNETSFNLDPRGEVVTVSIKKRLESERIIEEFMLAANQCAAEFLSGQKTGIFRIHEAPDKEKIETFLNFLRLKGYGWKGLKGSHNPLEKPGENIYHKLIKQVKDPDHKMLISFKLLTSMKQAKYDVRNIGHWGLGFKNYTHFTSPIRRYPDLMVHRLIYQLIKKKKNSTGKIELKEIAEHSSIQERRAQEAEWEIQKVKSIRYLRSRVSEIFTGIVTHVIDKGFFVKDTGTGIEGFIDQSFLNPNFSFDGERQVFFNPNDKMVYGFGQKIKFKLVSVNLKKLFIDFKPVVF